MARPPNPPRTALGQAMRAHRGEATGDAVAESLGMNRDTFYRIERGAHGPSVDSALTLARWLGWTVEEVVSAARRPAGG